LVQLWLVQFIGSRWQDCRCTKILIYPRQQARIKLPICSEYSYNWIEEGYKLLQRNRSLDAALQVIKGPEDDPATRAWDWVAANERAWSSSMPVACTALDELQAP
jgi:hypothetical protein